MIVVEAGGNGYQNLDDAVYSTGNGGHWPFRPENDSGAIIVGAGSSFYSSPSQARLSFSNYGSTVAVQGWGEYVYTTGYGYAYSAEGVDYYYTYGFGGTSSASPIVAGASALVESAYKTRTGNVVSPAALKQLLRATGSPQQGNTAQNIGPFPNLSAALASLLPPRLGNVSINDGLLHFVLSGSAGDYVIETSSNLVQWTSFITNTIPASGSVDVFDSPQAGQLTRFYRARAK